MFQSLYLEEDPSWFNLIWKGIIFILVLYFSFKLAFSANPWIFLDNVNLLIHESGHFVFGLFGDTLSLLGGTIMQIIFPLMFLIYFIKKADIFSASFCLFWLGDNFINISIYVKDAKNMYLPLVGGGIHDWNTLLSKWGMLNLSYLIGEMFYIIGLIFLSLNIIIMLACLITLFLNIQTYKSNYQ